MDSSRTYLIFPYSGETETYQVHDGIYHEAEEARESGEGYYPRMLFEFHTFDPQESRTLELQEYEGYRRDLSISPYDTVAISSHQGTHQFYDTLTGQKRFKIGHHKCQAFFRPQNDGGVTFLPFPEQNQKERGEQEVLVICRCGRVSVYTPSGLTWNCALGTIPRIMDYNQIYFSLCTETEIVISVSVYRGAHLGGFDRSDILDSYYEEGEEEEEEDEEEELNHRKFLYYAIDRKTGRVLHRLTYENDNPWSLCDYRDGDFIFYTGPSCRRALDEIHAIRLRGTPVTLEYENITRFTFRSTGHYDLFNLPRESTLTLEGENPWSILALVGVKQIRSLNRIKKLWTRYILSFKFLRLSEDLIALECQRHSNWKSSYYIYSLTLGKIVKDIGFEGGTDRDLIYKNGMVTIPLSRSCCIRLEVYSEGWSPRLHPFLSPRQKEVFELLYKLLRLRSPLPKEIISDILHRVKFERISVEDVLSWMCREGR